MVRSYDEQRRTQVNVSIASFYGFGRETSEGFVFSNRKLAREAADVAWKALEQAARRLKGKRV